MFLPSLLEYSQLELIKKLELTNCQKSQFLKLTSQKNQIHFHLDFVLKNFAHKRKVEPSLEFVEVCQTLESIFGLQRLNLSIHFMGDFEDVQKQLQVFLNQNTNKYLNKNWIYTLFLPAHLLYQFEKAGLIKPLLNLNSKSFNLSLGSWYDLDQWDQKTDFEAGFEICNSTWTLLMTVFAGKSGQKLADNKKQQIFEIAQKNPSQKIIADGGWQLQDKSSLKNLQMVSYSSFWNYFLK